MDGIKRIVHFYRRKFNVRILLRAIVVDYCKLSQVDVVVAADDDEEEEDNSL